MAGTRTKKKPKVSRKTSFPTKLLLLVNIFFILLLAFSILASYISPLHFWPLAFAGLAYPFFLLANLFFVLFWIVFLKKYFIYSLIVIAIGYNQFFSFIQFRTSSEKITVDKSFKVMSYNVRLFDLYQWNDKNDFATSRHEMMKQMRSESPDILCLQEYYNGKKDASNYADSILSIGSCKYYFDAYIDNGRKVLPFGLITFSKYPIINASRYNFSNTYQNYCIITDIAMPTDTLRVINTHLESIRFGKEDYYFVNELANNSKSTNDFTHSSRAILSKMKHAYQKRAGQVEELSDMIRKSPYKVLLCADFNDTPVSFAYRQIENLLDDSFKDAGSGLGQTYAQILPILRIDYIFHDKSFVVKEYHTLHNYASDHYPIVSVFEMPN
jgi:endonuclease/exonuclease/phosphatase family metal-dependent hydrolase